jgi:hypothetical protein
MAVKPKITTKPLSPEMQKVSGAVRDAQDRGESTVLPAVQAMTMPQMVTMVTARGA